MSQGPKPGKPSKALKVELEEAGIRVGGPFGLRTYAAGSSQLSTLLRILSNDELAQSSVCVWMHYMPGAGDVKLWSVGMKMDPMRELTAEITHGIEFWHDNLPPCDSLAIVPHTLRPAIIGISKIIQTMSHPPPDTCPIAFALPEGTYIGHAEFHFTNFSFGVSIRRC